MHQPERLALLDRPRLTGVTDEEKACSGGPADLEQTYRLAVAKLPGLVDNQGMTFIEPRAAARKEASNGARYNIGLLPQFRRRRRGRSEGNEGRVFTRRIP
ncbi:hypothetical protein D9M73_138010 [compost metagenome]